MQLVPIEYECCKCKEKYLFRSVTSHNKDPRYCPSCGVKMKWDEEGWGFSEAFEFVKANAGYSMSPKTSDTSTAWQVKNIQGRNVDRKGNIA